MQFMRAVPLVVEINGQLLVVGGSDVGTWRRTSGLDSSLIVCIVKYIIDFYLTVPPQTTVNSSIKRMLKHPAKTRHDGATPITVSWIWQLSSETEVGTASYAGRRKPLDDKPGQRNYIDIRA